MHDLKILNCLGTGVSYSMDHTRDSRDRRGRKGKREREGERGTFGFRISRGASNP